MSDKKININIVLANLTPGGAERVLTFVARSLNPEEFNCRLVIIGQIKDTAYNTEGIDIVYFEKSRVLNGIFKLYSYLRKEKPDIVLSCVGHVNTVTAYLSIFFPKIKFIAREVNVLSVLDNINGKKFNPFDFFANRRFNYFDRIICQSQDMLNDLQAHHNIKQDKFVVINNPITTGFKVKSGKPDGKTLQFITVARFKKQKGHARIIEALSKVSFPFHYTRIGYGSQKEHIYELIQKYDMADKVTNVRFTDEVPKFLEKSDLYLQGSYVEGFPNALIESCAVGVPVLAFDAPGGLNEIIIDGQNGHIVSSEEAFVEKLNALNENYYFNAADVSEAVTSRYSGDIIIKRYEQLFRTLQKDQ